MLDIKSRRQNNITILALSGRFIAGAAMSEFNQTVKSLIAQGERQVVVNLAGVPFLDSCGIGELVAGYTAMKQAGGVFALSAPVSVVREVLRLTRIGTMITIYPDDDAALAGIAANSQPAGN